jgi:hypothetical protein
VPKLFISYRRQDSSGYTGWLHDRLAAEFGADQIFLDLDAIDAGADFVRRINDAVGNCDVLIAVIGDEWLTTADPGGRRRLDDPADFVRLEIAASLERDVTVIPVLVAGAAPPRADQLPEPIKDLANRQAIELTDSRWDYDISRLIAQLRELDGSSARAQPEARGEQDPLVFLRRHKAAAAAAFAGLVAAVVIAVVALGGGDSSPAAPASPDAAAGTADKPAVVISDVLGHEVAEPESFSFSVNGDLVGHDLVWSGWGDPAGATATGVFEVRDQGLNSIALPGTLLVSEMRQCLGKSYYTRADVDLPRNAPFEPRVGELSTPCTS